MKIIIPAKVWTGIKSLLPGHFFYRYIRNAYTKKWRAAKAESRWNPASRDFEDGINLVGYLRTVKGISEAARSSALALDSAGIPYTVNDFEYGIPAWQQVDVLPKSQHGAGFKFNANLIHVNPPQLPFLWNAFMKDDLTSRYNIGVWYWELPELPEEWRSAFGLVDEVWAATQFIFDSIFSKTPVPVVKIPPCIHLVYDEQMNRSDFNLPSDRFLFMCAYDVLSIQARKNPLAAVEAFKRAFPKNDSTVGLVIKVNNAVENPQEIKRLYDHVNGYANCYIIEDVLGKLKFNSLLNVVNAFVSLHRSEGFGLIPAEAMGLGKPVIMTRWSGNLDFMTPDNSCGVDYRLVPVGAQSGPYTAGQFWADPDIDHAAFFMKKLFWNREYYQQISIHARKTIETEFSPDVVGGMIRKRLEDLGLFHHQPL